MLTAKAPESVDIDPGTGSASTEPIDCAVGRIPSELRPSSTERARSAAGQPATVSPTVQPVVGAAAYVVIAADDQLHFATERAAERAADDGSKWMDCESIW